MKIDQSFTRNLSADPKDAAISEGTKTKEQIDILVDKGCTRFRGYYFGRPATAEDFTECLKSQTYSKLVETCFLGSNVTAAEDVLSA